MRLLRFVVVVVYLIGRAARIRLIAVLSSLHNRPPDFLAKSGGLFLRYTDSI